ncbi:MAG: methenyltetrahydromethanopterin cyclohydrolase, partial [Gemmataceae bacterium]|nr:methenyltetrahydromethanopterin cyclohydrolase [Gemmataceae bacterium]
ADDDLLTGIGPQVPARASRDYGLPFAELFRRYNGDFYQIDPHLFAPAIVEFRNLRTGRCHRFGQFSPDLLIQSFGRS